MHWSFSTFLLFPSILFSCVYFRFFLCISLINYAFWRSLDNSAREYSAKHHSFHLADTYSSGLTRQCVAWSGRVVVANVLFVLFFRDSTKKSFFKSVLKYVLNLLCYGVAASISWLHSHTLSEYDLIPLTTLIAYGLYDVTMAICRRNINNNEEYPNRVVGAYITVIASAFLCFFMNTGIPLSILHIILSFNVFTVCIAAVAPS